MRTIINMVARHWRTIKVDDVAMMAINDRMRHGQHGRWDDTLLMEHKK